MIAQAWIGLILLLKPRIALMLVFKIWFQLEQVEWDQTMTLILDVAARMFRKLKKLKKQETYK